MSTYLCLKKDENVNNLFLYGYYLHSYMFCVPSFIFIYKDDEEGTSFITFVQRSLYSKGDNVSKDEGLYPLTIVLLYFWCIAFENKDQYWRPPPLNSFNHLRQASTFVKPPKKTVAPEAALQPLDTNQETLREARSQKREATSLTPQEEELDQEIRDLEAIPQQVQKKKEKMLRLADLQRKIDEAAEEIRHLTQDDQDRRPQHRELCQENPYNDDEWYGDFHHGNFAFDDASPLAAELQATPWPSSYKPPQLPMYDEHSDPKQFLMSYEATISSYGGNTIVMVKSFVMAVKSIAQTWYSSLRLGTITS
jgi:hypothetical protein